jgi:hypothetical protein
MDTNDTQTTITFSQNNPEHMAQLKAALYAEGVLPSDVPLATEIKLSLEGVRWTEQHTDLRSAVKFLLGKRGWVPPVPSQDGDRQAPAPTPEKEIGLATEEPRLGRLGSRRGKRPRGWVVTVYGKAKTGKSTWAALAPRALIGDVENGIDNIDCASDPVPTWAAAQSLVEAFAHDPEFDTLVIDTADVLEKKLWEHLCRANKWRSIESPDYGKGYIQATEEWIKLINRMKEIALHKGKNFLFVAHSTVKQVLSPESDTYEQHEVNLNKKVQEHFFGQMDGLFFAHIDTSVRKNAGGDLVGTTSGQRLLTVGGSVSALCGNRFGLTGTYPLDAEIFKLMRIG